MEQTDKQPATFDQTMVEVLNQLLKLDPKACNDLLAHRVDCVKEVADHPTIRVQVVGANKPPKLGLLGLLNGAVEKSTGRRIVLVVDEGQIVGFQTHPPLS